MVNNNFIVHRRKHIRETYEPLHLGFTEAVNHYNYEFATLNVLCYAVNSIYSGERLDTISENIYNYYTSIKILFPEGSPRIALYLQIINNLQFIAKPLFKIEGEHFEEAKELEKYYKENNETAITAIHLHKMVLAYLEEEFEDAIEYANIAEKSIDSIIGTVLVPVFYTFDSLSRLAVYNKLRKSDRKSYISKVNKNLKRLKSWSDGAPMNFLAKYFIILAEKARVQNKEGLMRSYFDKAISESAKSKNYFEAGLANELSARFYKSINNTKIAELYLIEAYDYYSIWGATSLLKKLENKYSQFMLKPKLLDNILDNKIDENDISTVLKAATALSETIRFDELIEKLLNIAIENTGATKGILLLYRDEKLFIQAISDHESSKVNVLDPIPYDQGNHLATSVVNYTVRAKKYVIADNAIDNDNFLDDKYIIENNPKSILCFPILHKNQLSGVYYFENNLAAKAFTHNRVNIMTILSSQIAMSIDNAMLYRGLEHKVDTRTKEVIAKNRILTEQKEEIETQKNIAVKQRDELENAMIQNLNQQSELQNAMKTINEQNETLTNKQIQLEERSKEVTDSIKYAKRIQDTILPTEKIIHEYLPYSFVLYKPRDIVSGDFYWFHQKFGQIHFAAVDCTGHGVPGAFLSIIGHNELGKIIDRQIKPAKILDQLNTNVFNLLNSDKDIEFVTKEGMDMVLCYFDLKKKKLQFAAAHNSLYVIRNNELTIHKGEWRSIGERIDDDFSYTNYEIDIEEDDVIYMLTDGYADQYGGPKRKKFKYRRFKELIMEIHHKPMQEQKIILNRTFEDWKGENEQIDDVLVIGIKV